MSLRSAVKSRLGFGEIGRCSDVECTQPDDDGNFFKAKLNYKSAK